MGKYSYSEFEQQLNNVITYQDKELSSITGIDKDIVSDTVASSEELLTSLGYKLPTIDTKPFEITDTKSKKIIVVPNWERLCIEAEECVGNKCEIESIFTEEELCSNEHAIKLLNDEYNQIHRLDKVDVGIAVLAALVGSLVDILLVGIPQKTTEGISGGTLSNYVREHFDKVFPAEEMEALANSKVSKVPFDAQDNRHTNIRVDGLSAYYHRLLSLGHDPLLGFIIGVGDILNGTMTTIDKSGKVVVQVMENYATRKESDIMAALMKQIIHFKSDITTSMGLPVPLMGLFNLLQFGSIGEYEQTIAEIVQGMYYEGYDFIHFCSMSISTMLIEVVVRLGYFIKRKNDGFSTKESIPFSLDRVKHPKLATMLFMAHSGATMVNAGKVYFTKTPMAINYPQWIAFAKYSYQQLKWAIVEKPELRDKYVKGIINEQLEDVMLEVDKSFEDITRKYIVVFE